MDRWFEVSNRRSRLRSATRILLSSHHTPSDGTGGFTKNASNEGSPKRQRERNDRAEDDWDPDYRLFLDHLKVDGKSYVLEMKIGNAGPPVRLKYEGGDDPFVEVRDDDSSDVISSHSDRSRGKILAKKKGVSTSNSSKVVVPGSVERETECSMVDEDYQRFLNLVRVCNGSMVLELDNNITVRYEGEEDICSKQEKEEDEQEKEEEKEASTEGVQLSHIKIEEPEEESYLSILKPYIPSPLPSNSLESQACECEDDVCSIETTKYRVSPLFTNKLTDILHKPFDRSEYDNLMALATSRTPKIKLKHLRHMSKPYETGEMGHSYLDYYPKLANQIRNSDYHVGLVLLRGFFFWLENVVHDGAFMPWLSASSSYGTLPSAGCSPLHPFQLEMSEN